MQPTNTFEPISFVESKGITPKVILGIIFIVIALLAGFSPLFFAIGVANLVLGLIKISQPSLIFNEHNLSLPQDQYSIDYKNLLSYAFLPQSLILFITHNNEERYISLPFRVFNADEKKGILANLNRVKKIQDKDENKEAIKRLNVLLKQKSVVQEKSKFKSPLPMPLTWPA